jgi:hypothetical protein
MKYIYVLLASLAIVSCQKKRRIQQLYWWQTSCNWLYENGDGKTKSSDSMKVEMAKQEATKTQPQKK